jgi:hypothetical protein
MGCSHGMGWGGGLGRSRERAEPQYLCFWGHTGRDVRVCVCASVREQGIKERSVFRESQPSSRQAQEPRADTGAVFQIAWNLEKGCEDRPGLKPLPVIHHVEFVWVCTFGHVHIQNSIERCTRMHTYTQHPWTHTSAFSYTHAGPPAFPHCQNRGTHLHTQKTRYPSAHARRMCTLALGTVKRTITS